MLERLHNLFAQACHLCSWYIALPMSRTGGAHACPEERCTFTSDLTPRQISLAPVSTDTATSFSRPRQPPDLNSPQTSLSSGFGRVFSFCVIRSDMSATSLALTEKRMGLAGLSAEGLVSK